jgi:hypothetical protein
VRTLVDQFVYSEFVGIRLNRLKTGTVIFALKKRIFTFLKVLLAFPTLKSEPPRLNWSKGAFVLAPSSASGGGGVRYGPFLGFGGGRSLWPLPRLRGGRSLWPLPRLQGGAFVMAPSSASGGGRSLWPLPRVRAPRTTLQGVIGPVTTLWGLIGSPNHTPRSNWSSNHALWSRWFAQPHSKE